MRRLRGFIVACFSFAAMQRLLHLEFRQSKLWILALFPLALMGCETKEIVRGYLPDPELVATLEKGKDDSRSVFQRLGSPSSLSAFRNHVWYYIGEELAKEGFLEPKTQSRGILILAFDERGILQEVEKLDLSDGQDVEIVQRITPTEGQSLTILQQLIGNIGRLPGSGGATTGLQPGRP